MKVRSQPAAPSRIVNRRQDTIQNMGRNKSLNLKSKENQEQYRMKLTFNILVLGHTNREATIVSNMLQDVIVLEGYNALVVWGNIMTFLIVSKEKRRQQCRGIFVPS